ncbi:hypothetical protein D3C85_1565580 [compost metagenome]
MHAQQELEHPLAERVPMSPPVEVEPQEAYVNQWTPPTDAPNMPQPVDADRQRWIEELPLTPEERHTQALVRETKTASIETYAGGSGQQGGGPVLRQSRANGKATAAELCRRLSRRGRDLL